MNSLIRSRLLAATALLLVLGGGASYWLSSARADDKTTPAGANEAATAPAHRDTTETHGMVLGAKGSAQPQTMGQFLTAVTKDVDTYWTKEFKASGLPEPKVSYKWIPAGQTAASACGDDSGTLGDSAAAYCQGDDTIYISEKFATEIYDGTLNQSLPGSSQGYGGADGDFAVAYIVAHEYGHEVQDELGAFDKYGQTVPTMGFELQADCYAGNWAKSAYDQDRLDDGDVKEALNAALAVGDFDTSNPSHHGTPDQREDAWNTGFQSGDPESCDKYMDPANLGDGTAAGPDDPTTAPEDPTTAPEDPTTAPEDPTTAPDDPTTAPEDPTTAPDDPTIAPDGTDSSGYPAAMNTWNAARSPRISLATTTPSRTTKVSTLRTRAVPLTAS